MIAKAFAVDCEKGPNVQDAIALMQSEGYRFAQLEMPTNTYGWVIGLRFDMAPPVAPYPDSSGLQG